MQRGHQGDAASGDTTPIALRAAAGDAEATTKLYERFTPGLFAWASLRIRAEFRHLVATEDLVHEIWCRVLTALPRKSAEARFRFWLFRVARNVLLEVVRQLTARRDAGLELDPSRRIGALASVPDTTSAITKRIARDEAIRAFIEWVRAQPPEDAQLFIACGLEGLGTAVVARRLGKAPDTIRKHWQRLRAKLREQAIPAPLGDLIEGSFD